MKTTVLTYLETANSQKRDPVADQVAAALRQGGHTVSIVGAHGDVKKLITLLSRRKPDLVFNLMEMFGNNIFGDVAIAGLLDLLQVRYTGGGPGEIYLQEDKALAKKVLAFEGVLYPNFAVFTRDGDLETGGNLRMPMFVKPLRTDASLGISTKALVHSADELMKRVRAIHEQFGDSALAEEYIEGREFYVGIIGNREEQALPPIEMDFSGLKDGAPHVLGNKAKWVKQSAEYRGTRAVVADLPEELRARLHKAALGAYRALKVRDYGRVDLRLTDSNDLYVLEVNANCYLEQSSEFAMAAAAAGLDYPALINKIADLALERYKK